MVEMSTLWWAFLTVTPKGMVGMLTSMFLCEKSPPIAMPFSHPPPTPLVHNYILALGTNDDQTQISIDLLLFSKLNK